MMHSTQSDLEHLYRRLDEIRMSEHERLRAKAQLARAEAVAGVVAAAGRMIARLYRRLIVRPIRHLAAAG
jgi:hypothetical protein